MEDKIKLINAVDKLKNNDYNTVSTRQMKEKQLIATDFDQTAARSVNFQQAVKLSSLYLVPLVVTGVTSAFCYSRTVFIAKRVFRLNTFISVNIGAFALLAFININTFSLTQAYIGMKFVQNDLITSTRKDPLFCANYYKFNK